MTEHAADSASPETEPSVVPPAAWPALPLAGYLVLDKKLGMTSRQACSYVRNCFRRAGAPKRLKVGHGGTLDPLATGVLVVLVGRATKLQDAVMTGEKGYLAQVDLAHVSASDDREEELVAIEVPDPPSRAVVEAALGAFTGEIMQRPPAFSAISVDGRRAYALARADKPLKLEPRPVVIHALELVEYRWPIATLRIACGKGTYIRSLARDLGVALGTGGVLHSLQRTRVGPFSIDGAVGIDDLPDEMTQTDLRPIEDLRQPSPEDAPAFGGAGSDEDGSDAG
ncbi:MAG: tRNA pseudouridine(55) synthase TruB [Planctomycetota bacterium]